MYSFKNLQSIQMFQFRKIGNQKIIHVCKSGIEIMIFVAFDIVSPFKFIR